MDDLVYRRRLAFLFFLLPLIVIGHALPGEAGESKRRPNFLLVVADDMGWTDIGSFGGEILTPNLDSLAKNGVRFTDFHVSVSCSPTRAMLLSGTDNHIAGLGTMAEMLTPEEKGKPGYEGYLTKRVVSLAEVLREAGYHTYMAGKWHLGHEPDQRPYARGFERTFSLMYGGASHWSDMAGLMEKETPAMYTMNGKKLEKLPADFYSSRSYTDYLIHAIRENRGDGKPFLAYLAFTAPHDPVHAPEPWLSKYRGTYDDGYEALKEKRAEGAKGKGLIPKDAATPKQHPKVKPWKSLDAKDKAWLARSMEVYAGMVDNMDYHFGRIVNFLKDIGEYNNTVVIFLSDNGANPFFSDDYPTNKDTHFMDRFDNSLENIGNPGSNVAYGIGWASAGSGPLDYFKMTVGEGGIRSPLLISGPGIKGGRTVRSFAYITDIMPTILQMAGVKHPDKYQGHDVAPMMGRSQVGVLYGSQKGPYGPDEFIGGEMGFGRWMRRGDYKAVLVAKPYGSAVWELYNVVKDPGETKDLSKEKPTILKELTDAWNRYAKDVGVIVP